MPLITRHGMRPSFVGSGVGEGEEQAGEEAVDAGTEARRVADDGAAPCPAHGGAADHGGGDQAGEDLVDDQVVWQRRRRHGVDCGLGGCFVHLWYLS